uniref:TRPM-like domain-containing protein n=1 Tax=Acrobeloides nanus TaxID=290746 RepID=A0A914CGW2_9BILA
MDTGDMRRILKLAVKLDVPSIIRGFKLESMLEEEHIMEYLVETLSTKNRIDALGALLDQNIPIHVNANLLMKILSRSQDDHFFNTVVLGQCLGYTNRPDELDEQFATDIDDLLYYLSGGFSSLFKPEWILSSLPRDAHEDALQVLAIWALLMNETDLVKCLWAYSSEPLPLALILARVARTLAYESREWFYYEERLLELSNYMKKVSVTLLDRLYEECPLKAYGELCRPLETFNQLTLSQLAFETNNRLFIAHECCQKWLHFLLYKDLHFRPVIRIPNWLKIILAAFLVFPIKWWFAIRPSKFAYLKHKAKHTPSPTLALLENEKNHRNCRPSSMYSVHSLKSGAYFRDDLASTVSRDERLILAPTMTGGSATPSGQSSLMQQFVIDDVDETLITNFPQTSRLRRTTIASSNLRQPTTENFKHTESGIDLSKFYATPIVKYWISLIFRLLYLFVFSYSVALPGCGDFILDLFIWIWSLMWWLESLWVLKSRTIYTSWKQMRWATFDVVFVAILLLILLVFKVGGLFHIKVILLLGAYPAKVLWAVFLVYQCYATLFIYVPLSPVLGPLLVRVRLMILRDFTNFLILVFLAVCSGAISIKAILYPDLEANSTVVGESLSWAWLSLFTIDLSVLKESQECSTSTLQQNMPYCSKISGYGDAHCPTQSWIAYFTVVEYLIVIKLICWPLLFALFARTAKNVDQEADRIWKYQLYGLGSDFSYRPFLPPPLTALFFLGACCCQLTGCITGVLYRITSTRIDHPDVHYSSPLRKTSHNRYRHVRNSMGESLPNYWNRLAVGIWKEKFVQHDNKMTRTDQHLREALHSLLSTSNVNLDSSLKEFKSNATTADQGTTTIRLIVNPEFRTWNLIIPNYYPPYFSKPVHEFPNDIQKYAEDDSEV